MNNVKSVQEAKATTVKSTFSRETSVSISILADAGIVWKLLTNASDYPRWNSTVVSVRVHNIVNGFISKKVHDIVNRFVELSLCA